MTTHRSPKQTNKPSDRPEVPDDLRQLVGYWCSQVAPLTSNRFENYEAAVFDTVHDDPAAAILNLERLVQAGPSNDQELMSFFAAGDLENCVNRVVDLQNEALAAAIVYSPLLAPLLPEVWTEKVKDQLRHLAAKASRKPPRQSVPPQLTASYTINELTAFWCNEFCSRYVGTFEQGAAAVRRSCAEASNPQILKDIEILAISAPDEEALNEFVKPLVQALLEKDKNIELPARLKELEAS